uniref:MFS domain-containing protein n=1 Tax=Steinernema glaseri TaxID=37863 RepID=A0A1I7Z746_9BILA
MIAMTPILFKPSYLGMVFLKTLTLVSVFGLVHGLLLLPAILTAFDEIFGSKKVLPVLTLTLVSVFGLVHGLLLLPAILTAFDEIFGSKKVLPVLVLPIPALTDSLKTRSAEPKACEAPSA